MGGPLALCIAEPGEQTQRSRPKDNGPGQDKQHWHDRRKIKTKTQTGRMSTRLETKRNETKGEYGVWSLGGEGLEDWELGGLVI